MTVVPEIAALDPDMRAWRHHIHAHPETAFEETATSAFVADKLRSFGLDVHTGLAGTGVVGVLRNGARRDAIGLRADLDALHIHEKSGVRARLAATKARCTRAATTATRRCCSAPRARWRSASNFDGTAYFIFQPAEENEGGGRVMVEEGLFDRFPMQAVYGMHNWPRAAGRQDRDARRAADGRVRHLRDRRHRQAARTRRCRTSAAIRCCSPRT